MEPSGADNVSSYHRLRVVDGATQFSWPSARATAAPTVCPRGGRPTTISARSGAAAAAVQAASWSSTANDAWLAIRPATATLPKSRSGSTSRRPSGMAAG